MLGFYLYCVDDCRCVDGLEITVRAREANVMSIFLNRAPGRITLTLTEDQVGRWGE